MSGWRCLPILGAKPAVLFTTAQKDLELEAEKELMLFAETELRSRGVCYTGQDG
jgi:hypothetical protein